MSPLAAALSQPGKPLFEDAAGDIEVSFEFFPPKTEKMEATLWESVKTLEPLAPRFVSVTYGAGGSTRERTHATVVRIQRETALHAAAHLTCVEASRGEIDDIARAYWDAGIRHIVALRGDPPEPGRPFAPHPDGYANAAELVAGLKKVAPFEISVACYPECHPGFAERGRTISTISSARSTPAPTARSASSSSRPTASSGSATRSPPPASSAEITPGILPVSNVAQTRKFAAMCGATIPPWLDRLFEGLDDLPAARQLVAATRRRRALRPALCGRGPPIPFLHAEPGRAQLRHLPPARPEAEGHRPVNTAEQLRAEAAKRILIKDGAYGTQIQARRLARGRLSRRARSRAATRRAITTS